MLDICDDPDLHVCVLDLCDGLHMRDYYASWCPFDKVVLFGGALTRVPKMPAEEPPSEEQVWEWARKHEDKWPLGKYGMRWSE